MVVSLRELPVLTPSPRRPLEDAAVAESRRERGATISGTWYCITLGDISDGDTGTMSYDTLCR